MARYVLEVAYDGTAFHGSQLQGEIPTVQLAVNKALSTLLRTEIETWGASRTDEGVHALCNCYHFDYDGVLLPRFLYNLNAVLPTALGAKKLFLAKSNDFNARFEAISRSYRYRIYHKKDPFLHERALHYPFTLNRNLLNETADIIKQETNFETFSKRNTQTKTFLCKIFRSYWQQEGEELQYIVEANRFLRGMVRGLVGTQLQVARGKMTMQDFKDAIAARDCSKANFSVAGHGLYLEEIKYPEGLLEEIR